MPALMIAPSSKSFNLPLQADCSSDAQVSKSNQACNIVSRSGTLAMKHSLQYFGFSFGRHLPVPNGLCIIEVLQGRFKIHPRDFAFACGQGTDPFQCCADAFTLRDSQRK